MTTNVYFIRCGEFVKIGRGDNPHDRMRTFQCGNPFELMLMGSFEASPAEEARLQSAFEVYRHRAEWFFLAKPVRAFIEKHCGLPNRDFRGVDTFLVEQTLPEEGQRVTMRKLWFKYEAWRQSQGAKATLHEFMDDIEAVCDVARIPIVIEPPHTYILGRRLAT